MLVPKRIRGVVIFLFVMVIFLFFTVMFVRGRGAYLDERLRRYEHVAVWIEAVALVLIFGLDWRERIEQRAESEKQHEETREQLGVFQHQVEALRRQEEAMQRPALLFPAIARDEQDAILEMNGSEGGARPTSIDECRVRSCD
jgi:type VI protein secretion system component VasK